MSVMPLGGGAVGVLGPAPGTLGWDFKLFEKITASQQTSSSSSLATNHAADYGGLAATNRRMRRSGSFEESYAALSEDTLQEDDNDDNDDNDGAPALLSDDQLKEVFLLASKGTGELDVVGLHRVVEQLGFELTHAQAQELFSQWDEDGSGLIEEDEYLGLMRQVLEQEMKMWRNDKRVKPLTSATTLVHLRRREMLEALARRATATEKTLARNTRGRRAGPLPTHAAAAFIAAAATAVADTSRKRVGSSSASGSGGGSSLHQSLQREASAHARGAAYDLRRREKLMRGKRVDTGAVYRDKLERAEDVVKEHLGYDGYATSGYARSAKNVADIYRRSSLLNINTKAQDATDHKHKYGALKDGSYAAYAASYRKSSVKTIHAGFCFDADSVEADGMARERMRHLMNVTRPSTAPVDSPVKRSQMMLKRASSDAAERTWSDEPASRGGLPPRSVGSARPAGYDEASRFGVHLREPQNRSLDASTWARQLARREAVIRCTSPDARPRANSSLRAQRSTSSIGSLRAERSTSSIGSGRHLSATPSRVDLSSAGSSRNVFCHAFVGRHRNWCPPRRQPKT